MLSAGHTQIERMKLVDEVVAAVVFVLGDKPTYCKAILLASSGSSLNLASFQSRDCM
jgi:hypothetical protein